MQSSKPRASRISLVKNDSPAEAESGNPPKPDELVEPADLESELDKLALQIVQRATRKANDGLPVEPLPLQLNALKIAGAYFSLKRKHAPPDAEEGSGWGAIFAETNARALARSGPDEDEDEDGNEGEDEDEDEDEGESLSG